MRKYQFVKTYFLMLAISFGFQIAIGIWSLVTFYTTRNQSLNDCLDGTTDQTKIDYCNDIQVYKRYPQAYVLVGVIVPLVIQFCASSLPIILPVFLSPWYRCMLRRPLIFKSSRTPRCREESTIQQSARPSLPATQPP